MHLWCWTILTVLSFTYIASGNPIQINSTLVLPATFNSTTATRNEINPDHYDVAGTNIWLQVLRPHGASLPSALTLLCLANAEVELIEKIYNEGDRIWKGSYIKRTEGIKVYVGVVGGQEMTLMEAKWAILGVYELMSQSGGPGSHAITVNVNDDEEGLIAVVKVSWEGNVSGTTLKANGSAETPSDAAATISGAVVAKNETILGSRAAMSMARAVANVTSANVTGGLTPDHYIIPGTSVYVVVLRPYGHQLPHDATIKFLFNAAFNLSHTRMAEGDVLLPSVWLYQELGVSINFNSKTFNRPHLSTMQAGIVGLIDLMAEESVVGTKEILYQLGVESEGDMGSGQVRWVGGTANLGNETWVEVASAVARLAPISLPSVRTGLGASS